MRHWQISDPEGVELDPQFSNFFTPMVLSIGILPKLMSSIWSLIYVSFHNWNNVFYDLWSFSR